MTDVDRIGPQHSTGRHGFHLLRPDTWPNWVSIPVAFVASASFLSPFEDLAPPQFVKDWPDLEAAVGWLVLGLICAGIVFILDRYVWQAKSKKFLRIFATFICFVALLPLFSSAAGGLFERFIVFNTWSGWALFVTLAGLAWWSIHPIVMKMQGITQENVGPWETYSLDKAMPKGVRPTTIILSMSRPTDGLPSTLFETIAVARRKQDESDDAWEGGADPLKWVLETVTDEASFRHSWYQTVKCLRLHLQPRAHLAGESAPAIHVLVSHGTGGENAPLNDGYWRSLNAQGASFHGLLSDALHLHYGPWTKAENKARVEAVANKTFNINDYQSIEEAIKRTIAERRDRISGAARIAVDITSATKVYSAAAAIATLETGACISYVQQNSQPRPGVLKGEALSFKRLRPQYTFGLLGPPGGAA